MSVLFPLGLDAFSNPASGDLLNDPNFFHDVQHVHANDSAYELMSKVGQNGSTDINSLDYQMETHVHDPDAIDDGGPINHADLSGGTHPLAFHGVHVTDTGGAYNDAAVIWNLAEQYDTDALHDLSVNPSRLTVPVGMSGFWFVTAYFKNGGSSGGQGIRLSKTGVAFQEKWDGGAGDLRSLTAVGVVEAIEGDYFEAIWLLGAGNSGPADPSYFAAHFLGYRVTPTQSVSRSRGRSNVVGTVV